MKSFICVSFYFVAVFALVCQADDTTTGATPAAQTASEGARGPASLMPVILVRQQPGKANSGSPNIFLGFLQWEVFKPIQPSISPFTSVAESSTQQISQQMLDIFPFLSQPYSQFNQVGNDITSQMNPTQFMGQLQNMLGSNNPMNLLSQLGNFGNLGSMLGGGSGRDKENAGRR